MSWVDLSLPIGNGMPVYPGDPEVVIERVAEQPVDRCQLSRLVLGSHSGTHLDAPRHFIEDGQTILDLPLDRFTGRASVIACPTEPGQPIDIRFLKTVRKLPDILILSTGYETQWGCEQYFASTPWFAEGSANLLIELGIRLVGADLPTFREMNKTGDSSAMHKSLLGQGIILVENLTRLIPFRGKLVEFMALPLPIRGGDGSPVRAIARLV